MTEQKDEDSSLIETLKIMSNPELMAKIKRGDEQLAKGGFKGHELIEEDEKD
ncbi:hypothetical protein [Companilactobacillus hulinensis]|uniref:hypothetical protein n=1 Tax=Companilactobacillus hulinensis TaxID=2486007 RepID=UPI0013DE6270|nr:hypothetical protein [Companilactobacillus hulinensis]